MILAEMVDEARRLSAKIDAGVQAPTVAASKAAHAEHEYRLEKARSQLSALQSLAAAHRAEAEHAKYGIQDTP